MSRVRTEKDLDVLYREIFDYMAKHYHVSALTGARCKICWSRYC